MTCNAFNVPLLFLADVPGFMIGTDGRAPGDHPPRGEDDLRGLRGDGAEDLGDRPQGLRRRPLRDGGARFEPDCCIALPTASIAVMGPEAAINAVFYNQIQAIEDEAERERVRARKARRVRGGHRHPAPRLRAGGRRRDRARRAARRADPPLRARREQGPPLLASGATRSPRRSRWAAGSASRAASYVDGLDAVTPMRDAPPPRRGPYVLPHRIDHAANMRALADAGCDRVLALGSVGGLRPELGVGDVPLPGRLHRPPRRRVRVRATGARTGSPGSTPEWRAQRRRGVGQQRRAWSCVDGGVYWQAIGPRFETPAEIRLIAAHADVVGMTIASECVVAGELGLRYAAVCIVDNLANGVGERRAHDRGVRGRAGPEPRAARRGARRGRCRSCRRSRPMSADGHRRAARRRARRAARGGRADRRARRPTSSPRRATR